MVSSLLLPIALPLNTAKIPCSSLRHPAFHIRASTNGNGTANGFVLEEEPGNWDVSSNCVTPVFRKAVVEKNQIEDSDRVHIMFLSEGNVCRSLYAESIFRDLVAKSGISNEVTCSSKATTDYNKGETPDYRAVRIANEVGLKLPEGAVSKVFNCAKDVVQADLILVMDKFNASDVMKQVTMQEAVDKEANYSYKVRRLGEFCQSRIVEDIDDPLYGNMGDDQELFDVEYSFYWRILMGTKGDLKLPLMLQELLRKSYRDIFDCCEGLVQLLLTIRKSLPGSETLKRGLLSSLGQMEAFDWLVPPMLQR